MDVQVNLSCSVELWINKRRTKKNGDNRLYLQINVEGHPSREIKLRFYWPRAYYDQVKRDIVRRSDDDKDYLTVSAHVANEKAKYWSVVKKFILADKYFTPDDVVKSVWYTKIGGSLGDFIRIRSRERVKEKDIKTHTRDNHISTANILEGYKGKILPVSMVSKRWLEKYLALLMLSMSYSGAWSHIKNIRTYVGEAKKKGIAIHPTFEEFKLEKPESDPVWLEREELDSILKVYQAPATSTINKIYIKAFLFACFTGLRVSDLRRFDLSWIVGNEIVFTPVKQRITQRKPQVVKIPIIGVAKQFLLTLKEGDKLMERSDVKFNKHLKTIATLAGISKNLTSHVARHTFGTLLAIQNTPIAVIANLMGHKTLKSTMIYIHIAEKIRQNEMMRLQDNFSNFIVHSNYRREAV